MLQSNNDSYHRFLQNRQFFKATVSRHHFQGFCFKTPFSRHLYLPNSSRLVFKQKKEKSRNSLKAVSRLLFQPMGFNPSVCKTSVFAKQQEHIFEGLKKFWLHSGRRQKPGVPAHQFFKVTSFDVDHCHCHGDKE